MQQQASKEVAPLVDSQSVNSQSLNSLGFETAPKDTRVVVAMSGGVDSSTVAALLVEEGYDVIGITLQLYDHGEAVAASKTCCAGVDIHDARSVASRLGIRHFVLDYESRFKQQVMDDFADSYLRGETPIPCVKCNQTVKFTDLLATARELGAQCLATGHYVRRKIKDSTPRLLRGIDASKDQSYFLFATTPEQLDYLRFPLGGMSKDETRAHARRLGLKISEKPDSQDICFVPQGRYGDVVRKLRPGAVEAGDILYHDGTVLGRHNGVIDYTIGQRRGLGIGGRKDASEEPLYVVAVNADTHQVIVGERELLACGTVLIDGVNWLGDTPPFEGQKVLARLRHASDGAFAEIRCWPSDKGVAELTLAEPQYGIATGQAAVLYDASDSAVVLGGGWIVGAPTGALGI